MSGAGNSQQAGLQRPKPRSVHELSSKEVKEIQRLRKIAQHTSADTKQKFALSDQEVMVLCKYMSGGVLDEDELMFLLPLVESIKKQIQKFPAFYYDKIGLEISTDWVAKRSRVAVDEGAAKMFVAIPVKERADFARRTIEESPFLYGQLIEVFEGYGMDIELPTKVDFILYEPTAAGKAAKVLSPEENFILKMIKQKHLKFPDQWQRVLFI